MFRCRTLCSNRDTHSLVATTFPSSWGISIILNYLSIDILSLIWIVSLRNEGEIYFFELVIWTNYLIISPSNFCSVALFKGRKWKRGYWICNTPQSRGRWKWGSKTSLSVKMKRHSSNPRVTRKWFENNLRRESSNIMKLDSHKRFLGYIPFGRIVDFIDSNRDSMFRRRVLYPIANLKVKMSVRRPIFSYSRNKYYPSRRIRYNCIG